MALQKQRRSRIVVPCAHIADHYDRLWREKPSIGSNLLRHGYRQWAEGRAVVSVDGKAWNNLYSRFRVRRPPARCATSN